MFLQAIPVWAQTAANPFDSLKKGQVFNGFRTDGIFLDGSDKPIGGRFVHAKTGFVLDLLQIQSVPQAYIYTNTFSFTDMGEPHTQEHLLIGKGNKGRAINVAQDMSLTDSNASTYQTYTDYPFYTSGGSEVFYERFADYMDTLLYPDYTEEEVSREVRNWGIVEGSDDKLRIEEKGSVYNEMTSSMNNPVGRIYDRMSRLLFGEMHPLATNTGGSPEGIRKLTAADIKKYHDTNYHLANMGTVVALPKSMEPAAVLTRLDGILTKYDRKDAKRDFSTFANLPARTPARPGSIEIVDFPNESAQANASILFGYPAKADLDLTERVLLESFLSTFAGDASTNLYKKFIDSKTRTVNTGATGVGTNLDDIPMPPLYLMLTGVPAENLNAEKAAIFRQGIVDEFKRIALFKDGSPELKEFNDRLRSSLTNIKRSLSKFVSTPPGFGFRGGGNGDAWLWRARQLSGTADFKKSLTLKADIAKVEAMIAGDRNIWREYLEKWGYTTTEPYVTVAKPNPNLIKQEDAAGKTRADTQMAVLKRQYNTSDDQEAIRRYKADYDKKSAELDALEAGVSGKFISNPPLSQDPEIEYRESTADRVKVGESIFDNMAGATTGIAINLDAVPADDLVYLSTLPTLLRGTGVIVDGKPVSYEEMSQQLQKEILSLNATFSGYSSANRYELTVRGAGNDLAESERAVVWMDRILKNPNWTEDNIARIRDVVDQQFSALRRRMQGSEESWVNNPADAYYFQDRPLHLTTTSFLTQAHDFFRMRWMLKEGGPAIGAFLDELGAAKGTRDELTALTKALQGDTAAAANVAAGLKPLVEKKATLTASEQALAAEAAKDLGALLSDIPDGSLAADWAYLAKQMKTGLAQGPSKTLARLTALRERLLDASRTRMFYIGSAATRQRLASAYTQMLGGFTATAGAKPANGVTRLIDERLKDRGVSERPVYIGFVAPNMSGGVFLNSAPTATYRDTSRDAILDFLTVKLYGGSGPHAVFTKTINAGLAYSNGIGSSSESGRSRYYAERTPLLPQTLGFVIDEIKKPMDKPLDDYVIAQVFSTRAANAYESRGESMAADMAIGFTPDVVAAFRKAVLEARKLPDLSKQLYARKDKVYERMLPGYGAKGRDITGASFFTIGPEKQLSAYESYLKIKDGQDTRLHRLYPRDFWLVSK